jgi:biopolymer transport protein ExbB
MELTHTADLDLTQRPRVIRRGGVFRALTSLLAFLLLLSSHSWAGDTWWNEAWTARKKITVDTTQAAGNISEPVGGATVLLRLYEANYPATAKEDLSDLRFVAADDKTVLPHHVEKLDSLMGEAFVWVKLPDVPPNAKTTFWLYFGAHGAEATKTEDPKGSYDADAVLVFHFSENGSPATDSTKNANTAESAGGKAEGACIGSGVSFNGSNSVSITPSPSLLWIDNGPMTLSAWVKIASPQDAIIISRREGGKSLVVGSTKGAPFVEISGQRAAATTQQFAPGSWTHVAVVCDGGKTTLYVNGEQAAAIPAGLPGMNSPLVIGGDSTPGATGFTGELDELQVHKVARAVGFIQLAAFGQNGEKAAKVIAVGEPELPTNWLTWLTTGHFGVIIKNLTFDGWLVIIILAIMSVISWYVMFSKVRYLNALTKGNGIFMHEWRHVASDLTVLDNDDVEKSKSLGGRVTKEKSKPMRKSSVYRIYHIGVEEIRHRLAADRAEGVRRGLAGRSIQAVRASLDGGLVRETQKLNKFIVLLTICISGGPFLGLLGTVVGVMITFAAVAEAGEVNVNAIAPGIAAALLATVAGLAVAIPSLFGYNYILSRVKDAKDDMHVFIDEFVTRMAEFYREKSE